MAIEFNINLNKNSGAYKKFRQKIRDIPGMLNGSNPKYVGIHNIFVGSILQYAVNKFYAAFIQKSEGGTDEWGIKWHDLDPHTLAYSRKKIRKTLNLPGPKLRPTLTPAQDAIWLDIVSSGAGWGAAWDAAKQAGAWTLIDELGPEKPPAVLVNVDSGDLRNSLMPGVVNESGYNSPNQTVSKTDQGYKLEFTGIEYFHWVDVRRAIIPNPAKHPLVLRTYREAHAFGLKRAVWYIAQEIQGN